MKPVLGIWRGRNTGVLTIPPTHDGDGDGDDDVLTIPPMMMVMMMTMMNRWSGRRKPV